MSADLRPWWDRGEPWAAYLRPEMQQYSLWKGIADRVVLPGWALERFLVSPVRRLLVIAADWCGDATNTVPVFARLTELIAGMELRVLDRDRHLELMDAYRTDGSRSIPIVIALDNGLNELGHWGPRPRLLQEWMMEHKKLMPSPQRYAYARQWYARDRGASPLEELLQQVGGASD